MQHRLSSRVLALTLVSLLAACKKSATDGQPTKGSAAPPPAPPVAAAPTYDKLPRAELNRLAVRLDLPLYWIEDTDHDGAVDPGEVAGLLFYPTEGHWTDGAAFSKEFDTAYAALVAASKAPAPSGPDAKRQELVGKDLDQGRPTAIRTDFTTLSADDRAFVGHMLAVAHLIDDLYATQRGVVAMAKQVPADDKASESLFRRNRGPACVAPQTEKDPACSAIPGAPKLVFDVYPADLQANPDFCQALEKRPDADKLLGPFTVVRGTGDALTAVPFPEAYAEQMSAISKELTAAADAVKDPAEQPLVAYLRAAAASFTSNDWTPADEAWAKMSVDNSKWYVRVAPDETYWEPCAHKAGFHLTFARINQGSIEWQKKLVPVQNDMEVAIAERAGKPYAARKVSFHLPDFIDIVVNAGDDRTPLGATVGQSLPNWGPVANEGRGRTVAMFNLYSDRDSIDARHRQMASILDAEAAGIYTDDGTPGTVATVLHEATHNLGPAHEYKVGGKVDDAIFGGPVASVMEELKAQTGALFLVDFLLQRGLIDESLAKQMYVYNVVWAMGHISQGMYSGSHDRKTYGNVAAIQVGFLIDQGALTWNDATPAANGTDKGAFTFHQDKLVPAIQEMMKQVAGIKGRGDAKGANDLIARYVDSDAVVPHGKIAERFLRESKASFVYAVTM